MKARPILFSGAMVRALLDGRKTQTRRLIKPLGKNHPIENLKSFDSDSYSGRFDDPDSWGFPGAEDGADMALSWWCELNPYGMPKKRDQFGLHGSLAWVRETCRAEEAEDGTDGVRFIADNGFVPIHPTKEAADAWVDMNHYRGKRGATVPPIHMPRWASRITLEITNVRAERLQNISEEDAKAEGVIPLGGGKGHWGNGKVNFEYANPLSAFIGLWCAINGQLAWKENPWVWVVEFRVHKCNVDKLLRQREAIVA